jgi:formaldehyde-activating enzyme involved in methanogenesis
MATTPNYSWVMPDPTDLVTDLPADFEIFGDAVDATVFSNASAAIAKAIVDAKGDIIAATAADTVARLAVGANDTVLTADSSTATGLKWAAAGASGKVLQVIQGTTTTATTITGATYVDTTLTANITPSLATSKVLVLVSQSYEINRNGLDSEAAFRLMRGATSLLGNMRIRYRHSGSGAVSIYDNVFNYSYLDSPNTTSATTYKTMANAQDSVTLQDSSLISSIILLEIGA